jgi:ribonuclease HII
MVQSLTMLIIGTDEAGYGPNLGPLVVSLTAWQCRSGRGDSGNLSFLFEPLKKEGISIGDSKKLFHGGSLATLETGVLVPLRSLERKSGTAGFGRDRLELTEGLTPPRSYDQLAEKFETILQQHRVQLLDMQHRSVEPEEFNRLLDRFDSKGSLLSNVTLRLIADQLAKLTGDTPILVLCDKHGGRNHYLDLLTEFFPGEFIQAERESRECSIYRLTWQGRQLEIRFLAKGESQLPIALASMLAKYQRELAMIRFNDFWQSHVPDLQPTAGYPADAQRFKQQIAAAQKKLGIADENLWRKR